MSIIINQEVETSRTGYYMFYLFLELPVMSNILRALSMYRKYVGQCWPSSIGAHPQSRLSIMAINSGYDSKILLEAKFRVKDAMYLSQYDPILDIHDEVRTPSIFVGKREPVEDTYNFYFRKRESLREEEMKYVMTLSGKSI